MKFDPKFSKIKDKTYIFDPIRKKNVLLTDEEWVRQVTVFTLVTTYKYPASLIQLERGHTLNKLAKRTDILIFDRTLNPFLLIECKAEKVPISKGTINQALIYNKTIKAPFLALTNLTNTFCFKTIDGSYEQMSDLPEFI